MSSIKVGQIAPDFLSKDQNSQDISLHQFAGKKVILYFYPKDDTPGCTANACNFRDNYTELQDLGFAVIGVSSQGEKSHLKFIDKYKLPFPLIADTDLQVHEAYGVWGRKKFMGKEYDGTFRTTFVIDENQKVLAVIDKVDTKDSTAQIKKVLGL